MTNILIVKGRKVIDSIDYKITRKLNEVDNMTFTVFNDHVNRDRYELEGEVYVELIREWGVITRKKIDDDKIHLTWEQRAWHLKRRLYNETVYDGTVRSEVDTLIKEANTNNETVDNDIPYTITVSYHGIPEDDDTTINGNLNHNSYFEALQSICASGNYNMRFKGTNIDFGKFQNVINVTDNKRIVDELVSERDLSKFGNRLHIVGQKDDDGNQITDTYNIDDSGTRWIYDKVISSSKISKLEDIPDTISEYGSIRPIIGFQMKQDEYLRYVFEPGDILKVDLSDRSTGENGFYRVIKIEIGKLNVELFFEFSNDGVFSSRTFDPADTLSYIGRKIKEIEVFR